MPKVRYQLLFLSFVVLGIYYPALFAPFCPTDDRLMVARLLNQDHSSLLGLFFPHSDGQYYRPLAYGTFIADKYLWGLEASFMHLENVLLHLFNVLLVFLVSRALSRAWKLELPDWVPFVAGLVFAVHPINSEAVLWISGRTDVLAGFFILLSLWTLTMYLTTRETRWVVTTSALVLLGALAKETAIMFAPAAAFLVLCHDHRFGDRGSKGRLWSLVVPVAVLAVGGLSYIVMRSMALSRKDTGLSTVSTLVRAPSTDYLDLVRVFCKATGFYLKKVFLPLPLNFGIIEVSNYYVVPGGLFALLLVYLVYRRALASALTVSAFLILSPCFLLTVSKMSWTPVAERYLYMPCALFSILLAGWAGHWYRGSILQRSLVAVFGVLVLAGGAYATADRGMLWQDNYALAADTAKKSPAFAEARNDMAVELMRRGKTDEARNLLKKTSLGNFQVASLNTVVIYIGEGKLLEARRILYERLNGKDPRYPFELVKLLVKVAEQRRKESKDAREVEAINREQLDLENRQYCMSGDPFYLYRQGLTHLRLKDRSAAFTSFSAARSAAPVNAHYRQAAIQLALKYRP